MSARTSTLLLLGIGWCLASLVHAAQRVEFIAVPFDFHRQVIIVQGKINGKGWTSMLLLLTCQRLAQLLAGRFMPFSDTAFSEIGWCSSTSRSASCASMSGHRSQMGAFLPTVLH